MFPNQAPVATEIHWLNTIQQLGEINSQWASWLQEEASLTLRLKSHVKHSFNVRVLHEEKSLPTFSERQLLGVTEQECWIRQVYLEVDNQPWVFARSVMPMAKLSANAKQLIQVGNQALGHLLFANPQIQRGKLVFCRPQKLSLPTLWGRASCFSSKQNTEAEKQILVTEHFLQPMATQLNLPLA